MVYKIVLTKKAESERDRLSPELSQIVNAKLKELAKDPTSMSRKTVSPPYPPGGMMREFDAITPDGVMHYFVALFYFSQDEKSLIVHGIGHRAYDPRR
jgi:hypothetical protein